LAPFNIPVILFNKPAPRWLAIDLAVLRTLLPESLMVFGGSASDESCSSGLIPGVLLDSARAATLLGGEALFPGLNVLVVILDLPVWLDPALLFGLTTSGVLGLTGVD